MTVRVGAGLVAGALLVLAGPLFFAEPQKMGPPAPGKPQKLSAPSFLGVPPGGTVTVIPGPEPWYTVFGTGEVVGYIEPCG